MTLLPQKLKVAGYKTHHVGKAHIGGRSIANFPVRPFARLHHPQSFTHGFGCAGEPRFRLEPRTRQGWRSLHTGLHAVQLPGGGLERRSGYGGLRHLLKSHEAPAGWKLRGPVERPWPRIWPQRYIHRIHLHRRRGGHHRRPPGERPSFLVPRISSDPRAAGGAGTLPATLLLALRPYSVAASAEWK